MLGLVLCDFLNLHAWIIGLMTLTGALTFVLLAILAKIITGEEVIVYYHHEIAILIMCSIVLKLLHAPLLNYLDVTILGIATFLAFGRIGCFNVGCCHGRPVKNGIIYKHEHVEAGFTFYYEGVPLFPVQLVESIFVFVITSVGCLILIYHYPAGTVLLVYTVVYGAFRFIVEFFRGDPERPYWKGLSEAQWTTLLLVAITVVLSLAGVIPFYEWHLVLAMLLFVLSLITVLRENTTNKMTRPRHIREIAIALDKLTMDSLSSTSHKLSVGSVKIFQTDLGLKLSNDELIENGVLVKHYTVSFKQNTILTTRIVKRLAAIIKRLRKHAGQFEIFEKQKKVFHILFRR